MGIFTDYELRTKVSNLEERIRLLEERVAGIDVSFRVGPDPRASMYDIISPYSNLLAQYPDTRPTISIKDVVQRILDHLGLTLTATDKVCIPSKIELAKKPKAPK